MVPFTSVVKIVQVIDTILRQKLHQRHLINNKSLQEVKQHVLQETKSSTFTSLQQHSRESDILDQNSRDDQITDVISMTYQSYKTTTARYPFTTLEKPTRRK